MSDKIGLWKLEAGNETDNLIATKIMGWHKWKTGQWLDARGVVCSNENHFKPSQNLQSAFMMIRNMRRRGYGFCLNIEARKHKAIDKGWIWASFTSSNKGCYAATIPMAICRAALKAIMETEKCEN